MSEKFIPEHIEPNRYTEQSLSLDGTVKIADMGRLSANVHATDETVAVNLQFGRDEQGIHFLKGHIETKLPLQCQRCMQPFTYEIISDFALGIVNTLDEVNELPTHYEPVLTKEGSLALRELIEDEVILNLPIIPRHEPEDCQVKLPWTDTDWGQEKNENPFNVLESLKHKEK